VKGSTPDVVFSCLPHGVSAQFLGTFLDNGHTKVIDLSADFRLQNVDVYQNVYDVEHPHADRLPNAQYGLCELFESSIQNANPIGNPGCYPTSILLPLIPLLQANSIEPRSIIADSKSGVSGAGKGYRPATHFGNSNESFSAYKIGDQHRHLSEIKEQLEGVAGESVDILFTPHLVPMERGILSTIYAERSPNVSPEELKSILERTYENSSFVFMVPNAPATRDVKGTNKCYIYVYQPKDSQKVIFVSVIDNLLKGASGQAVQNMNILFGFPQETGLL
jgi:N-acetyl-gamma-glutamyl-phosphate reductase